MLFRVELPVAQPVSHPHPTPPTAVTPYIFRIDLAVPPAIPKQNLPTLSLMAGGCRHTPLESTSYLTSSAVDVAGEDGVQGGSVAFDYSETSYAATQREYVSTSQSGHSFPTLNPSTPIDAPFLPPFSSLALQVDGRRATGQLAHTTHAILETSTGAPPRNEVGDCSSIAADHVLLPGYMAPPQQSATPPSTCVPSLPNTPPLPIPDGPASAHSPLQSSPNPPTPSDITSPSPPSDIQAPSTDAQTTIPSTEATTFPSIDLYLDELTASEGPRQCSHCKIQNSPLWRRHPDSYALLCNACGLYLQTNHQLRPRRLIDLDDDEPGDGDGKGKGGDGKGRTCSNCNTTATSVWRRGSEGEVLCNACGVYHRLRGRRRPVTLRADRVKRRVKRGKKKSL